MSLEDIGQYSYLFTQGLLGKNKDGKLVLSAGPFSHETNADFELNYKDINELENAYNIKLVGTYFPDANYISRNLAIDELMALDDNGEFWSFKNDVRDVGFILSDIRYRLRLLIFKNGDLADSLIDKVVPIGLAEGGISDGIVISRDEFDQLLRRLSWSDETYKNKLVYYYDIIALIDDFNNHFVNIGHRFLSVEFELHKYLSGILSQDNPFPTLGGDWKSASCEYMLSGWLTLKLHQQYMDCIIGLYSLLDVFCKVAFEIFNLPTDFRKVTRLNSNGQYFTDLEKLSIPTVVGTNYTNTIFNKLTDYKELSLLRHEFVHRSSLNPIPKLFYGRETDIVNTKPICYACCFLWDTDQEGNPIRWKNRYRFYSQKRLADHYILKWTKKVSADLYHTITYLKSYVDELAEQAVLIDKVDMTSIFPSYRVE